MKLGCGKMLGIVLLLSRDCIFIVLRNSCGSYYYWCAVCHLENLIDPPENYTESSLLFIELLNSLN